MRLDTNVTHQISNSVKTAPMVVTAQAMNPEAVNQALEQIANNVANAQPVPFAQFIQNYGLLDQATLMEIAAIAANQL